MCQKWAAAARAHVREPFPDLRNGCTDRTQIWYVARHYLGRWLKQVEKDVTTPMDGWNGTWHVLQEVPYEVIHNVDKSPLANLPLLRNGWADQSET